MPLLSVNEVMPSEEGGPIARVGFNYQDEIAVSFLLEMIESPNLTEVHCETHDDIVLMMLLPILDLLLPPPIQPAFYKTHQ